jgi:hypothetical protein
MVPVAYMSTISNVVGEHAQRHTHPDNSNAFYLVRKPTWLISSELRSHLAVRICSMIDGSELQCRFLSIGAGLNIMVSTGSICDGGTHTYSSQEEISRMCELSRVPSLQPFFTSHRILEPHGKHFYSGVFARDHLVARGQYFLIG